MEVEDWGKKMMKIGIEREKIGIDKEKEVKSEIDKEKDRRKRRLIRLELQGQNIKVVETLLWSEM